MKITAVAPSNIALIKYWGKQNEKDKIPLNDSISFNLSNLFTTTTVELSSQYNKNEISINGKEASEKVYKFVDEILLKFNSTDTYKIVSVNNFPSDAGLSSSASGYAALTKALVTALGSNLSEKEISVLARSGSGSACRSIPDGFTKWVKGDSSENSYAKTIFPANYWKIVDIVAVLNSSKKEVASSEGQSLVQSSPFLKTRLARIDEKIKNCEKFIAERNFKSLGELIEKEALELHAIMLTSAPALVYWTPETLMLIKKIPLWRSEGLEVYYTINTGQNVHLICEEKNTQLVVEKIKREDFVKEVIVNNPAKGAYLVDQHLF